MDIVYFDNAATTPLIPEVVDAMQNAMTLQGNPSSSHAAGRKAKALIEGERRKIASFLGCSAGEIVFTSGGTEADNLAILGTVEANNIQTIISSKLEHPAVVESINYAQGRFGTQVFWLNTLPDGSLDLNQLKDLLENNSSCLVSLMHVNNEIGNIADLHRIGNLCKVNGAVFHTDAVQGVGHLAIDLSQLPVDLLSGSAHKINGPKGSGFLFVRKGMKIATQTYGGKQEREHRVGTENLIGIAGLGMAIQCWSDNFDENIQKLTTLKSYFISALQRNFKGVEFNGKSGDLKSSSSAILSVNFPDLESNELLLFQLDLSGVMVSGGSACSSGSIQGSPILAELGRKGASIRFSFSPENTQEEVDFTINKLREIIKS